MKKYYYLFTIILFLGCKSSSIKKIENTLGIKLPNNHIILKDTIEGNIDYVVNINIQLNNKTDIKNIINELKSKYIFKDNKKGFSFQLTSNDFNSFDCLVKIDTINNTLFFKEYHY